MTNQVVIRFEVKPNINSNWKRRKLNLLERRVEVEKRTCGTKVRDSSFDARGISVIVHITIVVQRHTLSEALGKRSNKHGRVEP